MTIRDNVKLEKKINVIVGRFVKQTKIKRVYFIKLIHLIF